jgi:glycosyltransferase involved in cell wall biosynthesis
MATATVQIEETRSRLGAGEPTRRLIMQLTWSLVAGGSEMYAYTIAANLDAARYSSFMCALDQGGPLEPDIESSRIPYLIMNRRPGLELSLMWRLYRLFKKHRPAVVHTHHFNQLFYSALGARLAGARIVHTEHSVEYLKSRRFRIALRLLSILCDRVIAIGNDGRRALESQAGIPARKLMVMRAGVNLSAFRISRSEARRALDIPDSQPVVAIVARLFPEKNHKLLLAAFKDVTRRISGARLLIVGEGVEQEAIADEISRLGLAGSVDLMGVRRDVARILAASDLFVLSSDREGLPIAVLEAMAAGKPVVATAVGDLPAIVRDGETGFLVPAHDPARLADAIVSLLSRPEFAAEMGLKGRRLVEESYSVGSMIARIEDLYGQTLGRPRT